MIIDGKLIAEQISADLRKRVGELQKKGITPQLAVILVGDDPASEVYVSQKEAKGEAIDVTISVTKYPANISSDELLDKIRKLNADVSVHGIIVQRPLPSHINQDVVQEAIADEKDVDGFKPESPFTVPIVMAVVEILEDIYKFEIRNPKHETTANEQNTNDKNILNFEFRYSDFLSWLKPRKIVLLGKGSTAGKPMLDYFTEIGTNPQLIDSKTENPAELTKQADIIISSVGKKEVIKPDMIKQSVMVISVGIERGEDGKLHGDYDEEQIKDIASYYTPTPGGVGPVNVRPPFLKRVSFSVFQRLLRRP